MVSGGAGGAVSGPLRMRASVQFSASRVDGDIFPLGPFCFCSAEKDGDSPPHVKKPCGDTAVKRGPGPKCKVPAGTSATAPATTDLRVLIRDTLQEVLKEQKDGVKVADVTPAPPGKYSRLVCMGYGWGLARYILGVNC